MPVIVKDMVRKAEVSPLTISWVLKNLLPIARVAFERIQRLARQDGPAPIHRLGRMAHHVTDLFHNKIQGGLEDVAYPLIIRESFFATAYLNQSGMHLRTVSIHHCGAEVLP